jgi:hypothetical protein
MGKPSRTQHVGPDELVVLIDWDNSALHIIGSVMGKPPRTQHVGPDELVVLIDWDNSALHIIGQKVFFVPVFGVYR